MPSGDQQKFAPKLLDGQVAESSVVTCAGSPPSVGTTKMSARPSNPCTKATLSPCGENLGDPTKRIWLIMAAVSLPGHCPGPGGGIRYVGQKAIPRDSSASLLGAIGALMVAQPQLELAIVGRATLAGRVDASEALSLARARVVVELLILEQGVPVERIEARAAEPHDEPEATAPSDGITLVVRRPNT